MKRQNGMTIIALMLTIIGVLVVVFLTILIIFGEDGFIQNAPMKGNVYEESQAPTPTDFSNVTNTADELQNLINKVNS